MNLHHLWAITLRYFYRLKHSYDSMTDMFYWPLIDLLLWGLTGRYFAQSAGQGFSVITALITGILFWLIIWRAQHEITVGLLDELWNKNLINLFVSPLRFREWVVSLMVIGILKALISFSFALAAAYLLYHLDVFYFGFYFLPFFLLLMLFGWTVGFFISSILMRYGTKIQTLAWTAVTLAAPFSAVYYPVSVLPPWAQVVSRFVPASYVFESARSLLAGGGVDMASLAYAGLINLVLLVISIYLLYRSYRHRLGQGLINLY